MFVTAAGLFAAADSEACTGISLSAKDGSRVVARTVEWSASSMQCGYVVAPRGHAHQSFTPSGSDGMKYTSVYGYVGIYTEYEPFVVEGMNEAGLSAGPAFSFRSMGNTPLIGRPTSARPFVTCSLFPGCCHSSLQ